MGSRVSAHNGPGEATLTPSILVRIQGSPSHVAPFGKKLRSHLKLHDLRFPERINEVACKVIGCRLGCCKLLTRILLPERESRRHQAHDEMLLPSGQAGDFARIRSRESWTRFTARDNTICTPFLAAARVPRNVLVTNSIRAAGRRLERMTTFPSETFRSAKPNARLVSKKLRPTAIKRQQRRPAWNEPGRGAHARPCRLSVSRAPLRQRRSPIAVWDRRATRPSPADP